MSGKTGYSAGLTLNTYTHATAQMKQDAADAIGTTIRQQDEVNPVKKHRGGQEILSAPV